MTSILSVKNLNFKFGEAPIFSDAGLEVGPADKIGLLSPNGTGKTTLFKILTGLLKAQGEISFLGQVRESDKDFQDLRRSLGFVLQNSEDQLFFPEVIEDVAFGPLNLGRSPQEAERDAVDALEKVGLAHLRNSLSFELSGGQKKLIALASILSMKPKMMLMDEPTSGLDDQATKRFLSILQALDIPWIIISHDVSLLLKSCNRFLTIHEGKLKVIEKPILHNHVHAHYFGEEKHDHP